MGKVGIALASDPKTVAIHADVVPSDPPDESTVTNSNVHTLNVQTAHAADSSLEVAAPENTAPPREISPPFLPIVANVPHLALGVLGIAVVLIWRMPEFAVGLFSRTAVSRLSVGERIGSTRGGFSYSLVEAVGKAQIGEKCEFHATVSSYTRGT